MAGPSNLPIEVLDYVQTHAPPADSPYGISQRELAKALGYHPCSMSRPLDQLVHGGFLVAKRGSVRDGLRKQLVYRLTESGKSKLARETRNIPLLSGAIPPPPNPFLGRREELAQLADFVRDPGGVVFIDGPAGMGKTALVSRHVRAAKRGRIPLWFTVRPASSPRQFVGALSHALSFLGVPQLAYYSQLQRSPLPREVADLAARALGDREFVLVIDDFQLADANLRKFLSDFVSGLLRQRRDQIYVVGQETPPGLDENVRVSRITLGGLDRSAAHELTDRRGGLAERFETVYQSALGSPLLLQLAVSNPDLEADAATLPDRIVARLPPEEVQALLVLALSNEPLPGTVVTDPGEMTAARLAAVVKMGVVQRTQQGRLEILQVVRSAMLSRVGPADERTAHLRLAEIYAGSHRPEAIRARLLHLVAGESWKTASQLLAQQEKGLFALGYSDALRSSLRHLAVALPRGPAKVRALFAEATILRHHSDYPEAINTLRRAIAESGSEGKTACEGYLQMVDLYARLHQIDEARQSFDQAERIGPSTRRLQVYFELSRARLLEAEGHGPQARPQFQGAFELARRFNITDLALESIAAWSRLEEVESGPEVALEIVDDALPQARSAGRIDIAFNLLLVRARAYFRQGQIALAEEVMRAVKSEAESLGYLNQLTYSLHGLAAAAFQGSRWAEGQAYARQACSLAERLGNDLVLGHTLALICSAEVREASGKDTLLIHQAISNGRRSIEVLSRLPPSEALVFANGYLAEAYFDARDYTSSQRYHRASLALCDALNLSWIKAAAESDLGERLRTAGSSAVD